MNRGKRFFLAGMMLSGVLGAAFLPQPPAGPQRGGGPQVDERSGQDQRPPRRGDDDRGRDDWDGPARFDRRMRDISEEMRGHIIAVVRELRPLSAEEEQRLREMDLETFRNTLQEHGSRIYWLARLRETQPDMYDLRIRELKIGRDIADVAERLRQARSVGRSEAAISLEADLRRILADHFDVRMRVRDLEIQVLEERVATMRQHLEAERAKREEHIEHRLQELLDSDGDGLSGRDDDRRQP